MIRALDSLTRRPLILFALTLAVAFATATLASSASAIPAKGKVVAETLTQPMPVTSAPKPTPESTEPSDGYEPTQCYEVEYSWFYNGVISRFVQTVTNLTTGISATYRNMSVSRYPGVRAGKPERGSEAYSYCDSWPTESPTDPPKG